MADEENKDAVDETPQDEAPQAETPEDAGPVAEEESSAEDSAAQTSEETPADPGREAEESADDGEADSPSEEESPSDSSTTSEGGEPAAADEGSAEEPAAAAEAAPEENPEDELPWKERRRLEKSRRPHESGPKLSPEERAARRAEVRKAKAQLRRKQRAAARAAGEAAGAGTPRAEREANAAKVRQGIVISDKGEKSITVRIDIVRRHPTYEKVVRRSRTLHAHDERNEAGEGDMVRIVETRTLSKTKRWRLVEVLERA
jgi:small subunit ribosomal protein S17